MATLEKQFEWLKEILSEKPEKFSDFFKEDFSMFLENNEIEEDSVKKGFGKKYQSFVNCKTKAEVREFVDKLISFILKYSNTDDLIDDYFA
jgi:hypothetical protein